MSKKEKLALPVILGGLSFLFWRLSIGLILDWLPFQFTASLIALFIIFIISIGPKPLKLFTENKKVHIATKWIVWLTTWVLMTILLSRFITETLPIIILITAIAHAPIKK